jgi:UDP-N-acetylmuramoyl-L-alanyl-D-glutamate--2,6-diaminopimelate ligase
MTLLKLIDGITVRKMFQTTYGHMVVTQDLEINRVQYDSRRVAHGDVFVAIRGTAADGHAFVQDAVNRGAIAVVVEDDAALPDSFYLHAGVAKIVVPDSRQALAQMAARYYDYPSRKLTMVGVTGTNGKTTTAHLIRSIVEHSGRRSGLIGTIEYKIGDEATPATHTTPESLELNELLDRMVRATCSVAVMEVSSHALHQHRVDGLDFAAAVFTNLTQDHLDYHGSMENYFNAKRILFERLSPSASAVINVDDDWGKRIPTFTDAKVLSYGIDQFAGVRAKNVSLSMGSTAFTIVHDDERTEIVSPLIGRFNVSNIVAAFATGLALGIPKNTLRNAIHHTGVVRGRFEQIQCPGGWTVVIDYAHTPDALEKALIAVHDVMKASGSRGRVIAVFGCGGNRDQTKRPRMAAIATRLSDVTIVTSDNPRNEDPESIIDEAMTGVQQGATVQRESDRSRAITSALEQARRGDVILIAGKGHEDYQIIGDRKIPFSDREVVEEFLRTRT